MLRICSPLAFLTCRPTGASDGAKYFWPCVGTLGGGAGLMRSVMPDEVKTSPSLPALWRNALLSLFLAMMP
jgi:hypothetical protein